MYMEATKYNRPRKIVTVLLILNLLKLVICNLSSPSSQCIMWSFIFKGEIHPKIFWHILDIAVPCFLVVNFYSLSNWPIWVMSVRNSSSTATEHNWRPGRDHNLYNNIVTRPEHRTRTGHDVLWVKSMVVIRDSPWVSWATRQLSKYPCLYYHLNTIFLK